MTEQERMERAKRIRRMREGNRADDQNDETDEADADEEAAASNGSGGAAVAESGDEAAEPVGTRAPVPSAEEMQELQDQAGVEAVDATPEDEATDAEAVEAPDAEAVEAQDAETDEAEATAGGAAVTDERTTTKEPDTRVLEFTLADEQYCLDIEYIEEIVKQDVVTRVPNTPDFIEGVVDLRGQITTILNPKMAIGKDDSEAGDLIVVFDPDNFDEQGNIGWVVDDVRQVSPVAETQINEPPMEEEYIQGVIDREDDEEFVIWTTPDLALDEAA